VTTDARQRVLDHGRSATTTIGYRAMLAAGRGYPQRRWAIEGCNGIGRHIAQRLVADGEKVIDVPSKLPAQVRVFATGQGWKTDPIDAHSVAVDRAAQRRPTRGRRRRCHGALRLLVDRRDSLGRTRTDLVNRLHVFLLDLIPGGAKKDLSARQARALLCTAEPADLVGCTRHQLAGGLVEEIETIDAKIKAADRQLA
jgi:transposase